MSIQAVAAVLDADVQEVPAKMLLVCLANAHNGSTGLCAPSISRLELESGMARSTVHKWLRWLAEQELIEIEERRDETGRQMSNTYRLTLAGRVRVVDPGVRTVDPTEGPNCVPSQNVDPSDLSDPRGYTLSDPHNESTGKKPEKGASAQAREAGDARAGEGKNGAAQRRSAKPSRVVGPDGRTYLTFAVSEHRKFVTACLSEWGRDEGKDRTWMAQSNSVSIPLEIVERTRGQLAEGAGGG